MKRAREKVCVRDRERKREGNGKIGAKALGSIWNHQRRIYRNRLNWVGGRLQLWFQLFPQLWKKPPLEFGVHVCGCCCLATNGIFMHSNHKLNIVLIILPSALRFKWLNCGYNGNTFSTSLPVCVYAICKFIAFCEKQVLICSMSEWIEKDKERKRIVIWSMVDGRVNQKAQLDCNVPWSLTSKWPKGSSIYTLLHCKSNSNVMILLFWHPSLVALCPNIIKKHI